MWLLSRQLGLAFMALEMKEGKSSDGSDHERACGDVISRELTKLKVAPRAVAATSHYVVNLAEPARY